MGIHCFIFFSPSFITPSCPSVDHPHHSRIIQKMKRIKTDNVLKGIYSEKTPPPHRTLQTQTANPSPSWRHYPPSSSKLTKNKLSLIKKVSYIFGKPLNSLIK
ncbi:unnamed protein product [Phytomonas sp. Hart1]|nr:unnamed protein product [Phytomonas sp. Hart1]|eukprot:CCW66887.1 unnamed protein product [Phytomonas sp. isolate Hart1]